jgi:hypothetical protein
VWRKRRTSATLDHVVELLHGIGVILMEIDAKLEANHPALQRRRR